MLRLRLGPADLARVRVAEHVHPAANTTLACQALRDPATALNLPGPAHRMAGAAARMRPLHHLIPSHGLMPDFLTPNDGGESLEAGLAAIRSTARSRIRTQVAAAYANVPATPMRRRFADADPEVLDTVVAMLRHYFRAVLEPYWPAVLRARRQDVDEAARRFVLSGVDGVLAGLPSGLRWQAPVLEIDTWPGFSSDLSLDGCGVVLVPSPFTGPRPRVLVRRGEPALIVYRADPPGFPGLPGFPAADAVDRLLGPTRGSVLRRVARPGRHTTSSVAREVGISASSSSEHLAVLRGAGLISSHRVGGAVEHRVTPLGMRLLS